MDQSSGPRNGGGSVRRAREQMQAGIRPPLPTSNDNDTIPIMLPPQYISQAPASPSRKVKKPAPAAKKVPAAIAASRNTPAGIGAAISRPEPAPQWPLRESPPPSEPGPTGLPRGPAPQRPPRPSHVPSLLDSSKIQDYAPSYPANQAPKPQNLAVPRNSIRAVSAGSEESNRASAASSVGTIPDFPIPAAPSATSLAPPRRAQNSNPPPLARRGASSYYSQASYISPIPEEFPESMRGSARTGGSIASSRAIPSSWGSAPEDEFDFSAYGGELSPQPYVSPDGDDSETEHDRYSGGSLHSDHTGLVKQASVGKRGKPSLTTVFRSGDDSARPSSSRSMTSKLSAIGQAIGTRNNSPRSAQRSMFLDSKSSSPMTPSPLSSQVNLGNIPMKLDTSQPQSRSPLTSPTDPLGPPVTGFASRVMGQKPSMMSDKVPQQRRPPRLNIGAVREAEARGSMTSLPDLIRRATRLASNLDRGKTASRIGSMHFYQNSRGEVVEPQQEKRQSGGISDMLDSFPPPRPGAPRLEHRPTSRWPSPWSNSNMQSMSDMNDSKGDGMPRQRRCCGLPVWAFILLCTILILVVAAAIIIPIVLIVIPAQEKASASSTTTATDTCSTTTCENSGVAVASGSTCRCICVNGFTGSTCSTSSDAACTTFDDSTSGVDNATVGSDIPRVFNLAQSTFDIDLNSSTILSLFSSDNVSCTSENALITFDSSESKQKRSAHSYDLFNRPTRTRRSPRTHVQRDEQPVATENGIVYAVDTGSSSSSTTSATASATSSAASSSSSSSAEEMNVDFARVAVLFILEETSSLNSAVSAQEAIQDFFDGSSSTTNSTMEMQTFVLNFVDHTITLENGTVIGGGN